MRTFARSAGKACSGRKAVVASVKLLAIRYLMATFRIDAGLPPYGPRALSFPDPDAFREGLVVTFTTSKGERWTGNFAHGPGQLDAVRDELGSRATIVVSHGAAYFVDVDRKAASEVTWPVEYVECVSAQQLIVIGNGLWFEAVGASGRVWRSRRISWDGMRSLRCDGFRISGEGAYSPMGLPDWLPFELDLTSGMVEGGSYNGPP